MSHVKKEKDFILLSEFAEIRHGPQPVCTIPEGGNGSFDITAFSVRIFSTDFQQGQSDDFVISPDSQVLLTEPSDGLFAYVHYFAVNDIQARGYLRQYCLSYLTHSPSKLIDQFHRLQEDFYTVTSLFKYGNHKVFMCDLKRRLNDIIYSIDEVSKSEADNSTAKYDSSLEDVPETDMSVLKKDMSFTQSVISKLDNEMKTENNMKISSLLDDDYNTTVEVNKTDNSMFYINKEATDSSYKPSRIMAHISERFTRQLRSLDQLSQTGYTPAMSKVHEIHQKYNRSELALTMELIETELLDPISSVLSVGRVPLINMQSKKSSPPSLLHPSLLHPSRYNLTNNNGITVADLSDPVMQIDLKCDNTLTYLDPNPRQRIVSVIDPTQINGEYTDPRDPLDNEHRSSRYNTPEDTPPNSPPPVISNSSSASKYTSTVSIGSDEDVPSMSTDNRLISSIPAGSLQLHTDNNQASPDTFHESLHLNHVSSIQSLNKGLYFNHINDSMSQGQLPFLSSIDLIESCHLKPGKDITLLLKDTPELRDILFSLLVGRPLVIIAQPRDESSVRKYINALWLFVGGYTSHYQVIPWQTQSIDLRQFPNVSLVGISSHVKPAIQRNLKKHVSYWDWTTNELSVPTYTVKYHCTYDVM
jgi:hypothetical protein